MHRCLLQVLDLRMNLLRAGNEEGALLTRVTQRLLRESAEEVGWAAQDLHVLLVVRNVVQPRSAACVVEAHISGIHLA
jgi:hypothetical protein